MDLKKYCHKRDLEVTHSYATARRALIGGGVVRGGRAPVLCNLASECEELGIMCKHASGNWSFDGTDLNNQPPDEAPGPGRSV
jgi:hypothetical protein